MIHACKRDGKCFCPSKTMWNTLPLMVEDTLLKSDGKVKAKFKKKVNRISCPDCRAILGLVGEPSEPNLAGIVIYNHGI